jgi:hypothetical protein
MLSVSLSEQEWAAVQSAADESGMAVGAWLTDGGVRVARGALRPGGRGLDRRDALELGGLEAALRLCAGQLRRAGVNLNQLTARVNATGEIGAEVSAVLARVGRAVTETDAALAGLGGWMREVDPTGAGETSQAGEAE